MVGREHICVAFAAILIAGCGVAGDPDTLDTLDAAPSLHGDLRLIANDSLDTPINVSELRGDSGSTLYGIGMPMGLDRELLIIGGRIHLGGYDGSKYTVEQPDDAPLAFAVTANVSKWQAVPVPECVQTFDQLESFIVDHAALSGLAVSEGFVFRVEGHAESVDWFVVGGMGNGRPDARASFLAARTLGLLTDRRIEIVGFHVPEKSGVATSPGSATHMHFRTLDEGPLFVGHLDDELQLRDGATLFLPT